MDWPVDESCLRDVGEMPRTTATVDLPNGRHALLDKVVKEAVRFRVTRENRRSRRRRCSSLYRHCHEKLVSKGRCSISDTDSDKSSERRSRRSRKVFNKRLHQSPLFKKSRYPSLNRSAHTTLRPWTTVTSVLATGLSITRTKWQAKRRKWRGVQTDLEKSNMFYGSDPISILAFRPLFGSGAMKTEYTKVEQCGSSIISWRNQPEPYLAYEGVCLVQCERASNVNWPRTEKS